MKIFKIIIAAFILSTLSTCIFGQKANIKLSAVILVI